MNLQLSLARVGQPSVLIHAELGIHHESIKRSVALVKSGQAEDEEHLVLLTPDDTRLDAVGSRSEGTARSMNKAGALPEKNLKVAMIAALTKQNTTSPPPCQRNPEGTGPRWLPMPCSTPAAQSASPGGRP